MFPRPQLTPRERIQAESERRRLGEEPRSERRMIRRDQERISERGAERRRSDEKRAASDEQRGDERGRPQWREHLREAGGN